MKNNLLILKQLEQQIDSAKKMLLQTPPKQGWVRTIRKALGMTMKQLARRLEARDSEQYHSLLKSIGYQEEVVYE